MLNYPLLLLIVLLCPCVVLSVDTKLEDVYIRLAALEDRLAKNEQEIGIQKAFIQAQERSINVLKSTVKTQQHTIGVLHQTIQSQATRIKHLQDYVKEHEEESEDALADKHIGENDNQISNTQNKSNKAFNKREKLDAGFRKTGISKRQVEGGGVAFSAYLNHDITTGQGQTVQFNKIITNEGNAYNNHTGVFTCPEAGLYLFSFSVGQRDSGHQAYVYLTVNSKNIIDAVAETMSTTEDDQGSNTVVIRLSAGDSVWISTKIANHHIEGSELRITSFTGVYLYP